MDKIDIEISDKNRKALAKELNKCLADEHVLFIKTRNFHWNVVGMRFMDLHKLFEGQYTELHEGIDALAERIRKIGHHADGTMAHFLQNASIKETEGSSKLTDKEMLAALVSDHESIIQSLRSLIDDAADKYKDVGTADFLTGMLEMHEKMAWMLRSYLA